MIDSKIDELLKSAGSLDDSHELEGIANRFATSLIDLTAPAGIPELMVERLEERRDRQAATILAAIAILGSATAAETVEPALVRLREQGVHPQLPSGTGEREVEEAVVRSAEGADLYLVRLRRPGDQLVGAGLMVIELEDTGGALVDGALTEPDEEDEIDQLIHHRSESGPEAPPRPVSVEILTQALRDSTARTRELGLTISSDLALLLALLGRALKIDRADLELPVAAPVSELQVDQGDEEQFDDVSAMLVDDFTIWVVETQGRTGALWRSGEFFANSLLQWKFSYGDGDLGFWSADDVEEFLLDYAPRKLGLDEALIADGPNCVAGFLSFLEADEHLEGDSLPALIARCEQSRDGFEKGVANPDNWGPAKTMVAQMEAEGVDPTDQAALDAWVKDFNSRPFEERDQVFGGPIDRMAERSGAEPHPGTDGKAGFATNPGGNMFPVGWFPPADYEEAQRLFPEFFDLWSGTSHPDYCRETEVILRDHLPDGVTPALVGLRVAEVVAICGEDDLEFADGRHALAEAKCQRGEYRSWPPGRNEPCWCGSGTKYKRCCGNVT